VNFQRFELGELGTNCYLVWSGDEAGVIDPGGETSKVAAFIEGKGLKLQWIVNTHGHGDHIFGNGELKKRYNVPLLIHEADRAMLTSAELNFSVFLGQGFTSPDADRTLREGEKLPLGGEELRVIETPGHTPGGIALYALGLLFAGDTLFREGVGRTDLPGGNMTILFHSIREKLFTLPPETLVLSGHGSPTTIGNELARNPFG
jgi:hydroxyacylglutathione hydrolase